MSDAFRDRTFVVTGASSGIGAALCVALAARGARVVLAARRAEKLATVVDACEAVAGTALAVPTDVADRDACRALIDAAVDAFGGVDVLVNNAAISMVAPFEEVSDLDIFERLMRVNYLGAVACTHFALPHLLARRGLVVMVSSLAGKLGLPTRTGYAASKHALQGFSDSLRIELKGRVDVQVISPGVVETDIRKRALDATGATYGARAPGQDAEGMSVDEVVAQMLRAIERRERDVVLPRRLAPALLLRSVAPGLVDRIVEKRVPGAE